VKVRQQKKKIIEIIIGCFHSDKMAQLVYNKPAISEKDSSIQTAYKKLLEFNFTNKAKQNENDDDIEIDDDNEDGDDDCNDGDDGNDDDDDNDGDDSNDGDETDVSDNRNDDDDDDENDNDDDNDSDDNQKTTKKPTKSKPRIQRSYIPYKSPKKS
jgi:hypothetical protein